MSDDDQAGRAPPHRIREIADRLRRLRPDWSNPERYFENRSDLEHDLRRLAKEIDE
ncbi:hypothetical protein [Sphingomonas sanxanigenens]|uniref:Uncharacterized protein n=1 Tax=Sphingomonas sanxanigenens DSM 19645 = NX02 TaxID=1123269 RepID=W0ALF0_9SPHN|nr:hypothetical protein [Sphingomonas sanxanigenens]AHE57417.1 hypothetical protein NX02_29245 [Sphingomonas sanxanigenens DSM 19645 = NX02]